ncbi:hypothetical protein OB919_07740 [Halobacteria archaeon AArc-curdl1]|uniref:CRISPR-associated exonuclease Cas4 n=1 Tax=Natronosalvus hydrolyticus TaxID=2979988 RepID=A0AAP3E5S6_9EURY|nr:hypothetical protein [Halobacteria archaeon AArc-curdl1]
MALVPFSDLRMATYCPRKLYYARQQDNREPPPHVGDIRNLAFRYDALLAMSDNALEAEPIALEPAAYRARLTRTRDRLKRWRENGAIPAETADSSDATTRTAGAARGSGQATHASDATATTTHAHDRWTALCAPAETDLLVTGRECRGVVHKLVTDPLEPVLVATGKPPKNGVWKPQQVHAVAAAKAVAWEFEEPVGGAWLEYPAYGVIRHVPMTTRRRAAYRRSMRTITELDGPPARLKNRDKCEPCEYVDQCGVRTRSLRSLLGFG